MTRASGNATGASADQTPLNVVIVTYNNGSHIRKMLESLPAAAPELELRVVVVDNGSVDDTIEQASAIDGIDIVSSGGNLGYSGGINLGREYLGDGDLAVLNPDLTMEPGSLRTLKETVGGDIGIAIPSLVDPDGTPDRHLRRESSLLGTLGDSIFGSHWRDRPRRLTDGYLRESDYQQARDVAWGGAAAWVISRECNASVGPWDSQRYFLYSEETDYARRARALGFRVRYEPSALAVHHGGGSGTNSTLLALMSVNRVRYFEQYNHAGIAIPSYRYAVAARHALRASSDRNHREALWVLLNRRSWDDLPSTPPPTEIPTPKTQT